MIEVTKVKRLAELTTIEGTRQNGQHPEPFQLTDCPDIPEESFLEAMQAVEDMFAERMGFGKRFGESFQLTGITMSRNRADRRQYNPTGKLSTPWGDVGLTLPLLLAPDLEKEAANVLGLDEAKLIATLFDEGRKYHANERHQAKLQLDDDDEEEKEAA